MNGSFCRRARHEGVWFYVSWQDPKPGEKGIPVCRNISLDITGPTNAIEFAAAIMNAGLPEADRVAVLPPLSRTEYATPLNLRTNRLNVAVRQVVEGLER